MGKFTPDDVLDDKNAVICKAGVTMHVLSAEPADRAAVLAGSLASVAATFSAPADGDTNGRKRTCEAKAGVAVGTSGTGNHVALVDDVRLLTVTTAPAQAVASGGTVDIGAWAVEDGDPA